jgi:DinB superfamily
MDVIWKVVLWSQFGATIDMFGNALRACPEELWTAHMWMDPAMKPEFSDFWYVAYHTLFWLDLYLSGKVEGFAPPAPYNLDELEPQGVLPERCYTKDELLTYLEYCRQKCHETVEQLTDERAHQACNFTGSMKGLSFAELLVDNLRHVQEHRAQLNMFLGQQAGISTGWIARAKAG